MFFSMRAHSRWILIRKKTDNIESVLCTLSGSKGTTLVRVITCKKMGVTTITTIITTIMGFRLFWLLPVSVSKKFCVFLVYEFSLLKFFT